MAGRVHGAISRAAQFSRAPVHPRFAQPADAYSRQAYTRDAQVPTGTRLDDWGGIGNSLLDKERCFAGTPEPFDPRLGLSGGEDALFLRQVWSGNEAMLRYDDTRGTQLVILTLMLALFMLNVPVLAAFTVARYERV